MKNPNTTVPLNSMTDIPELERQTLMVMAIELYQRERESDHQFCHYTNYAHQKLVQFV